MSAHHTRVFSKRLSLQHCIKGYGMYVNFYNFTGCLDAASFDEVSLNSESEISYNYFSMRGSFL